VQLDLSKTNPFLTRVVPQDTLIAICTDTWLCHCLPPDVTHGMHNSTQGYFSRTQSFLTHGTIFIGHVAPSPPDLCQSSFSGFSHIGTNSSWHMEQSLLETWVHPCHPLELFGKRSMLHIYSWSSSDHDRSTVQISTLVLHVIILFYFPLGDES